MSYIFAAAVVIAMIVGIVKMAGTHAKMSEQEFEAEARRAHGRGHMTGFLQKIFDPGHPVERVQEQVLRVRAEEDVSGDRPKAGRGSRG